MLSSLFKWKGKRRSHLRGEARFAIAAGSLATVQDPWFWSHYRDAAGIVRSLVPDRYFCKGKTTVDFGCGDGATTLGVAQRAEARVVGVDLFKTFTHLGELAKSNLGIDELPENVAFEQNILDAPLPFEANSVDLIFSWSVFEHLADVNGTLSEFSRIARPGGGVFIQVEPLFFAPFGSHLQRLVKEPWAHLLHDEDEFHRMVESATDAVPEAEKDTLYRSHDFSELKRHLLTEYRRLNRITAGQLVAEVEAAGFHIEDERRIPVEGHVPTADLLAKHPMDVLMTNQIALFAVKH